MVVCFLYLDHKVNLLTYLRLYKHNKMTCSDIFPWTLSQSTLDFSIKAARDKTVPEAKMGPDGNCKGEFQEVAEQWELSHKLWIRYHLKKQKWSWKCPSHRLHYAMTCIALYSVSESPWKKKCKYKQNKNKKIFTCLVLIFCIPPNRSVSNLSLVGKKQCFD